MKFKNIAALICLIGIMPRAIMCMEQTLIPFHKIPTCIQDPHLVAYLRSSKIFIGGQHGFELVNPITHESIKQEFFTHEKSKQVYDCAVNKAKTKFAITIDDKAICYNAQTNEYEWEYQTGILKYNSVIFSPKDDNLVLTCSMAHRDAPKNSEVGRIGYFCNDYMSPLCCLPKTALGTYAFCNGELPNYFIAQEEILGGVLMRNSPSHIVEFLYNPSGDFKIIQIKKTDKHGESTGIRVVKLENEVHDYFALDGTVSWMSSIRKRKSSLRTQDRYGNVRMIELYNASLYEHTRENSFSPKAPCIAMRCYGDDIITLLFADNKIEFWNYKTKQLLEVLMLPNTSVSFDAKNRGKRIDFSSDYKQMLIASDCCYLIQLPLSLIYKPETIKKLCFIKCLLNLLAESYIKQEVQLCLPQDIANFIGMLLPKCYPNEYAT